MTDTKEYSQFTFFTNPDTALTHVAGGVLGDDRKFKLAESYICSRSNHVDQDEHKKGENFSIYSFPGSDNGAKKPQLRSLVRLWAAFKGYRMCPSCMKELFDESVPS
ncbi:MAG: hypothetical protein IJ228_08270 [Succinivibrio sp.]|nr:hypothetical protein [Succinivibrio sp.]